MDIRTTLAVMNKLPVTQSVLLRAPHGVGKSQVIRSLAEKNGKRLVDVRLGQMTEGDLLGLYKIEKGSTKNYPPEWFMQAVNEPCELFFDELNRALPSVLQGVFQIILDRRLGSYQLHPETRVTAAINIGKQYDVVDIEPALLDRFAVIDFEPTQMEVFSFFRKDNRVHNHVVSFLEKHPGFLEVTTPVPSGNVTPSRRSWEKVSDALREDLDKKDYSLVYNVCCALVGTESARAFDTYLKEIKTLSYMDVINGFTPEQLEGLTNTDIIEVADNISSWMLVNEPNEKQKQNFAKFSHAIPDEVFASMVRKLQGAGERAAEKLSPVLDRIDQVF